MRTCKYEKLGVCRCDRIPNWPEVPKPPVAYEGISDWPEKADAYRGLELLCEPCPEVEEEREKCDYYEPVTDLEDDAKAGVDLHEPNAGTIVVEFDALNGTPTKEEEAHVEVGIRNLLHGMGYDVGKVEVKPKAR